MCYVLSYVSYNNSDDVSWNLLNYETSWRLSLIVPKTHNKSSDFEKI